MRRLKMSDDGFGGGARGADEVPAVSPSSFFNRPQHQLLLLLPKTSEAVEPTLARGVLEIIDRGDVQFLIQQRDRLWAQALQTQ